MHGRFAGVRWAEIASPAGVLEVAVAEGFRLRLIGLMGLEQDEVEPLLFPKCRSIHTLGMKAPIDLVWLSVEGGKGVVLDVVECLAPGGHAKAPRNGSSRGNTWALELAPGEATHSGLVPGAELTLR
jgi:uncharacterized membrane protein (UPF0127 family)